MKLMEKLFKPHTVISIGSDLKKNRVYTVDVTTQKFYAHSYRFKASAYVYPLIGFVLFSVISIFVQQFNEQLASNDIFQSIRILLIALGIVVGLLVFFIMWKMRYIFHFDEYLSRHPEVKKVRNINEVIESARLMVTLNILIIIGSYVASINMFKQFLNNSNLVTYFWALFWFFLSSALLSGINHFIFILGLRKRKYLKGGSE